MEPPDLVYVYFKKNIKLFNYHLYNKNNYKF